MINCSVEFKPNLKTEQGLKKIPDIVLYTIAREVLDLSQTIIPKDKGRLRSSSMGAGVRGTPGDYYIGSYTDYASYVWNMNDNATNWSEPGTHSQWYIRTIKEKGTVIVNDAVNRAWKDTM